MDVGLELGLTLQGRGIDMCFNPCFDGCRPRAARPDSDKLDELCFNPCFDGCRPRAGHGDPAEREHANVSILVLMDVGLELYPKPLQYRYSVFQSLF